MCVWTWAWAWGRVWASMRFVLGVSVWFVCPSCVPLVRVSVVSVGVNFD